MKEHLFSFLAIFLLCAVTNASAQTIHYVKEGGTGDGTSWANASGDLQLMINSSVGGNQVWVAGGIYYPIRRADALNTVSVNNRDNAFVLKRNVKIYGGFAGTETALTQRDSTGITNITILSGDLGAIGDSTDNAYHVVISAGNNIGTAELNGFSIKDGNANGTGSITVNSQSFIRGYGGGIYNSFSPPFLTNLIIIGNNATSGGGIHNRASFPVLINVTINRNNATEYGGGIYNWHCSPVLTDVTISGNNASQGGGIYSQANSPVLTNVIISDNVATWGGGIFNNTSSPVLTNVTINGNNADYGGGLYNNSNSSPVLTDVTVSGNNAPRGGGFYNNSSSPLLTDVTVSENNGSSFGGGFYNASSSPVLTNVKVIGNRSGQGGGFYNNTSSSPVLTNVLISGNSSTFGAGFLNNSSSPILTNVTISGNFASSNGGGIYNNTSSFPKIRNTIIYGNTNGIFNSASSAPEITYSLVQGLTDESNGNISGKKDPLFSDPLRPGLSTDGDYRLKTSGSPAYNSGSNTFYSMGSVPDLSAITTDLDGNQRTTETINIGAYESSSALLTIYYVKEGGTGDGTSWASASGDLQLMINSTEAGDQVWVAGGTYYPIRRANDLNTVSINDRNNAFVFKRAVKIYGGFAGNETMLSTRDLSKTENSSILSGNLGDLTVATDNAYHVIIGSGFAGNAELNGFTIRDGNADGSGSYIGVAGLGIPNNKGGGMYNFESSPYITNVKFSGNNADKGGGIFNLGGNPVLTNVTVSGNNAISNGGGIFNSSSSPVLTNVTISGNIAVDGGGIYNQTSSSLKIRNTIIYGNSQGIHNEESTPYITHSLVQGLTNETFGNISGDKDPLFVGPLDPGLSTDGNYRLKNNTSPAYNSGSIAFYNPGSIPDLSAITTDLDGNPRNTATISLGAYEYSGALPVTIANFTAQAEGNRAKLIWTTATEINNKEFIISRSADGITFSEIGTVAGAGNTNTRRDYLYYDENPLNGNNFYQLEQLDFDGRRNVAGMRNVQFASLSRINIYPNPVKNTLQLEFKSGIYQKIEMTDVNGRVLKVGKIGLNDTRKELNLSTFTSGTYFLRFVGNGQVETRRVVKE